MNPYRIPEPEPEASAAVPASSGAVLKAVAFAAERFLAAGNWRDCIDEVLAGLGEATGADRILMFVNDEDVAGVPSTMVPAAEWTAPGIDRLTGRPGMNDHPYQDGHERWIAALSAGEIVLEKTDGPAGTECACMAESGTRSAVLVPVISGGQWWGFVVFNDCTTDRDWDPEVVDALRTAAALVGAAVERGRTEGKLR